MPTATIDDLEEVIGRLGAPVSLGELARLFGAVDRLHALGSGAVVALDEAGVWAEAGATSMRAWVRDATRCTHRQAGEVTRTATALRALPATRAAWEDGRLSGGHVESVRRIVPARHRALFADHEAALVDGLSRLDVRDAVTALRVWVEHADALDDGPEPVEAPSEVHLASDLDGYHLHGHLSAGAGATVAAALRAATTRDVEGEPARTPAQRAADALEEICRTFLGERRGRGATRARPHVNVVVDLDALLTGRGGELTDRTAALDGPTVAALACDSVVHRAIRSPGGAIVAYGRATRTIPQPLYDLLEVRDRGCRFAGCDRPPRFCDGHHVEFWGDGGPTDPTNVVLLCRRHHTMVHKGGWALTLEPDEVTVTVTDPNGITRTSRPPGTLALPPPDRPDPPPARCSTTARARARARALRSPDGRGATGETVDRR